MPAKFKVEITRTAEKDIADIWSFIAQDSPSEARRFVTELEKQAETLERFPERCPLIPESELLGFPYRHLLHQKYRTIFRVAGKMVYVLRIIHGARLLDPSSLVSDRVESLLGSVKTGIADLGERHREHLLRKIKHL